MVLTSSPAIHSFSAPHKPSEVEITIIPTLQISDKVEAQSGSPKVSPKVSDMARMRVPEPGSKVYPQHWGKGTGICPATVTPVQGRL